MREQGLATPRRAQEQTTDRSLLARARRRDEHRQVRARLLLADELVELLWTQRGLCRVLVATLGGYQLSSQCIHHRPDPRMYLFGSSSAIDATVSLSPSGTITRALA